MTSPKTDFTFEITWKEFSGTKTTIKVHGRASEEEAIFDAKAAAEHMGWTAPKWWQFWRAFDTRLSDFKVPPKK